jgi:hypothetical protein
VLWIVILNFVLTCVSGVYMFCVRTGWSMFWWLCSSFLCPFVIVVCGAKLVKLWVLFVAQSLFCWLFLEVLMCDFPVMWLVMFFVGCEPTSLL